MFYLALTNFPDKLDVRLIDEGCLDFSGLGGVLEFGATLSIK